MCLVAPERCYQEAYEEIELISFLAIAALLCIYALGFLIGYGTGTALKNKSGEDPKPLRPMSFDPPKMDADGNEVFLWVDGD